jgi:hypothetical protein
MPSEIDNKKFSTCCIDILRETFRRVTEFGVTLSTNIFKRKKMRITK